ncbi:MAG TPA: hydrogenase maturation protease [Vicinamibacterales bacterium]|nr:hydrogenase maturation protease [Vicinamibacterales bacterium]
MSDRAIDLLVLGLGNVLLGDDGAGPAVIARLRQTRAVGGNIRMLDGGTLGLSLLPHLEDARRVILVDAVAADAPAGTLVRLTGAEVGPAVATRLSPHQVGVADLLEGARWHDREPQHLVLLGVVPESIELGVGLSQPVRGALPELIELVCAEARACGFPLDTAEAPADDAPFDVARLLAGAPL